MLYVLAIVLVVSIITIFDNEDRPSFCILPFYCRQRTTVQKDIRLFLTSIRLSPSLPDRALLALSWSPILTVSFLFFCPSIGFQIKSRATREQKQRRCAWEGRPDWPSPPLISPRPPLRPVCLPLDFPSGPFSLSLLQLCLSTLYHGRLVPSSYPHTRPTVSVSLLLLRSTWIVCQEMPQAARPRLVYLASLGLLRSPLSLSSAL
jgi:hypothetical protein